MKEAYDLGVNLTFLRIAPAKRGRIFVVWKPYTFTFTFQGKESGVKSSNAHQGEDESLTDSTLLQKGIQACIEVQGHCPGKC